MTVLTASAVLALAVTCQSVVSPTTIVKIAMHESGGDTLAIHMNSDGSRDRGLMQINNRNDDFLGLNDPFDPCQSISAAARLLQSFSRYNTGSPTRGIGYATAVQAVRVDDAPAASIPASTPPAPQEMALDDEPAGSEHETIFVGDKR